MKYLKRQEGIAQLLIVGLIALVLAVVGLAVWQSRQAKTKADQTASSPTPTPAATGTATPASSATPTPSNEFKVTELGFKMTLPSGLSDASYTAQTNLPGTTAHPGTYSTSSFATNSLTQADSRCTAGSVGYITRYDQDPSSFMGTALTKKVGSFYLVFVTPSSPCSDKAAAEQLQSSQTGLLRQAFNSATAL